MAYSKTCIPTEHLFKNLNYSKMAENNQQHGKYARIVQFRQTLIYACFTATLFSIIHFSPEAPWIAPSLRNWSQGIRANNVASKNEIDKAGITITLNERKRSLDESIPVLPRILAIVFPQYHADPVNDNLWGEGFTDWDNLRKAPAKNRLGYDIPRPTELGWYNLTEEEPRRKQGELARQYGIDGFVYHHYWFYDPAHPGPTLQAPLEAMLKDGHPSMPFCLHWCALDWVNTWMGKSKVGEPEGDVLQQQFFPNEKKDGEKATALIVEHYNWLRRFFHHPNYIKVQGQPVFMLWRTNSRAYKIMQKLRELAKEDGFPGLYFTVGQQKPHPDLTPPLAIAHKRMWMEDLGIVPFEIFNKTINYPYAVLWNKRNEFILPSWCPSASQTHRRLVEMQGILTSFDNTPRRNVRDAVLWSADEPEVVIERFRKNVETSLYYETCCFPNDANVEQMQYDNLSPLEAAERATARDADSRFIFINSMNEWAEGMALEPSDVFGRGFLKAIQDAKRTIKRQQCGQFQGFAADGIN